VTVVVEVGEEAVNIEIGGIREAVISAEAETKALAIIKIFADCGAGDIRYELCFRLPIRHAIARRIQAERRPRSGLNTVFVTSFSLPAAT